MKKEIPEWIGAHRMTSLIERVGETTVTLTLRYGDDLAVTTTVSLADYFNGRSMVLDEMVADLMAVASSCDPDTCHPGKSRPSTGESPDARSCAAEPSTGR